MTPGTIDLVNAIRGVSTVLSTMIPTLYVVRFHAFWKEITNDDGTISNKYIISNTLMYAFWFTGILGLWYFTYYMIVRLR